MKKFNYFSSFFAALAVFFKIYKVMRENGLSFLMLTHIKEVDAEKKVKKIIAIFQEEAISRSAIKKEIRCCEYFYQEYFKRKVNLSSVKIPVQKPGMDRLYIMIPGISVEKIFSAESEHFTVDAVGSFSGLRDDRDAIREPYAWWGSDSSEPNSNYQGKSGKTIRESGVTAQTLKERLIQGFMYWDETRDFLDKRNTTLCAGTQNEAGEFPTVDFGSNAKGVCINWVKPGIAQPNSAPREIAC